MSRASVAEPVPATVSNASISLNPPRRLAISPAGKGSPSKRRHDTNHVEDLSRLGWIWRDSGDFELPFLQPELRVRERAFLLS